MILFFNIIRILRVLKAYDALFILRRLTTYSWLVKLCVLLPSAKVPKVKKNNNLSEGERLAMALTFLGPVYVKLGQTLSVRPDIVGKELASGLRGLQDQMPFFPYDKAKEILEKELSKPINKIFSHFEKTPVAAASIAQVHKARLLSGENVAVKIIRPDIRETFAKDIKLLKKLAKYLEKNRNLQRFQPYEAIENFTTWSMQELDFRNEAAACSELRQNFFQDKQFEVPEVHWQYSGRDVLVLDWVEGVRIDDVESMQKMGLEPAKVLELSVRYFFRQVYTYGFFHGDVHPGNIFVTKEGVLKPIDFGIMGRISPKKRRLLAELLMNLMMGKYINAAEVLDKMGFIKNNEKIEHFAHDLRVLIEPSIHKSSSGVSFAGILQDIIYLGEKYNMQFDPDLLLLDKTMLQAEGVGKSIDPKINVWQLCEPEMEKWLIENHSLEAKVAKLISFMGENFDNLQEILTNEIAKRSKN